MKLQQADTGVDTTDWELEVTKNKTDIKEHEDEIEDIRTRKAEYEKAVDDKKAEALSFQNTAFELSKQMEQEEDKLRNVLRSQDKVRQSIARAQTKYDEICKFLDEVLQEYLFLVVSFFFLSIVIRTFFLV
jgi:chromosome segregation ATPase